MLRRAAALPPAPLPPHWRLAPPPKEIRDETSVRRHAHWLTLFPNRFLYLFSLHVQLYRLALYKNEAIPLFGGKYLWTCPSKSEKSPKRRSGPIPSIHTVTWCLFLLPVPPLARKQIAALHDGRQYYSPGMPLSRLLLIAKPRDFPPLAQPM